MPPNRLGLNHEGYGGARIDPSVELAKALKLANQQGWIHRRLPLTSLPGIALDYFERRLTAPKASVFISAGIHGDEPASTLALIQLMADDLLNKSYHYVLFPCLNPRGMSLGQRQTPEGADLNRDYLHQLTEEVRTQLASIDSMHPFDLALFLHEDWEANGFYLYELLDKESQSSIGDGILNEVARHAPLEMATVIDGREASNGLIQAPFDPCSRHDWPEAFYFMNRGTPHCLTLEAPSDFELKHRVHWLQVGVRAALEQLHT